MSLYLHMWVGGWVWGGVKHPSRLPPYMQLLWHWWPWRPFSMDTLCLILLKARLDWSTFKIHECPILTERCFLLWIWGEELWLKIRTFYLSVFSLRCDCWMLEGRVGCLDKHLVGPVASVLASSFEWTWRPIKYQPAKHTCVLGPGSKILRSIASWKAYTSP